MWLSAKVKKYIDDNDDEDNSDNDDEEDDNYDNEFDEELICVFGHRNYWPWLWTPPTWRQEQTYFNEHHDDDDGKDGEWWSMIKIMIRIMMLLMVILIKILCDFSEILLWSKHRWHIYVSRRSILSPLWIPGCLYVRVCMAICVSAGWPNKHPQTVGNLWPPIFKKEKLGTDLIPAQEQRPLSLKQRLCCFQKYSMPVSWKLFQSLGQVW